MKAMVIPLRTRGSRAPGFTLLELSLVLVIIGILIGVSVSSLRQPLESAALVATNNRMQMIRDALKAYKDLNGRLPCPADPTVGATAAGFGDENGTAGTCTGGGVKSGSGVVEGSIPFAALGLPAQYTFDGWKRRFVYTVYAEATRTDALRYYGPYTGADVGISVQDASGSLRDATYNKYIYLLMSYGKNGHGAYNRAGTRINRGSTNTSEQTNCHCDASAVATAYSPTYIDREAAISSTSATDSVDDILLYQTFSQLRSPSDNNSKGSLPTQTTQAIAAPDTGGNFATSIAMGDINGDGYSDLIFGMPDADNGATDTGSIYVVFGTPRGVPEDWSLSSLGTATIIRFDGSASGMKIGTKVAAGDVNSDGYADIITSAINGSNSEIYVVYGKANFSSTTNTITQGGGGSFIDGTHGYLFTSTYFSAPDAIAIGDLNGDAVNDIAIGSSAYSSSTGDVVVIFGRTSGWSSSNTVNATYLNGKKGMLITSTTTIGLGTSVAIGDTNADGKGDLLIGAPTADNGGSNTGSVYVLFGRKQWQASYTEASIATYNTANPVKAYGTITFSAQPADDSTITLNGVTWTFKASGAVGNQTNKGASLSATLAQLYTDLNASVNASLSIASYSVSDTTLKITCKTNDTACNAYTLATSTVPASNGTRSAADLTDYTTVAPSAPIMGLRFDGPAASTGLGSSVAVGDINGDGNTDLVMGASTYSSNAGAIFVVFGTTAWLSFANTLDATFLNAGAVGMRFDPSVAATKFGSSLAVGDIDNNGFADIFAPTYTGGSDEAYIIFGQSSYAAANYTLETTTPFDSVNGTTLMKYTSSDSTIRLSPVLGDLNADGLLDMVFGGPTYNANDGRAYILYGQPRGWRTGTITY